MAKKKGRIMYVPDVVVRHLGDIKKNIGCKSNVDAFDILVDRSEVGKEFERVADIFKLKRRRW